MRVSDVSTAFKGFENKILFLFSIIKLSLSKSVQYSCGILCLLRYGTLGF